MQMTLRNWSLLFLLSLLWGGTFFFTAVAVIEIPPLTLVLVRISIASGILSVYLNMKGETVPRTVQHLKAYLTMGVLNIVVPFSLFFWAQTRISGSLASILNAATPIFSVMIAHALLEDEKITIARLAGVVLGLTGVAVLLGGNLISGASNTSLGVVACLCAVVFQGIAVTYGRRFKAMTVSDGSAAFGQLSAATLVLLPIALAVEQPWLLPMPGAEAIAASLALAVASTALAYVIFFRLIASAGAVNASLVTLLIPLSATLLGTTFLGERLEARHMLGMVFVAVGLIILDGRLLAFYRRLVPGGSTKA